MANRSKGERVKQLIVAAGLAAAILASACGSSDSKLTIATGMATVTGETIPIDPSTVAALKSALAAADQPAIHVAATATPTNSGDPSDATAKCKDGTYSYSKTASGTCANHGGIARWINHP